MDIEVIKALKAHFFRFIVRTCRWIAPLALVACLACSWIVAGASPASGVGLVGVCPSPLTACDPTPDFGIVGDSITVFVNCGYPCAQLSEDVAGGHLAQDLGSRPSMVRADSGHTIAQELGNAGDIESAGPRVFAENLGSNDVMHGNVNWQRDFATLLEIMLPAPCVILTTVSTAADYADMPTQPLRLAQAINSYIAAVAASFPNVHVVDWNAERALERQAFSADGVHPTTDAAQAWLAAQYAAAC